MEEETLQLNYLNNNIFINYTRFLMKEETDSDFNIFQITKFPHYEIVSSRVLEFYFNPSAGHGLGTLFLEALSIFLVTSDDKKTFNTSDWEVDTEVITNKQNRIDVLLTSDDYAVAIENKIYAAVYNDLNDYFNYVQTEYSRKNTYGVVLSLNPTRLNEDGWINITYKEFFQHVNQLLGNYFVGSNAKGLLFLHDFIENFDILKEGNHLNMCNPKQLVGFENFLEENYRSIINMEKDLKEYKKECVQLVENVLQIFDDKQAQQRINVEVSEGVKNSETKNYFKNIFKFTPVNDPLSALVIDTHLPEEPEGSLATDFEFGYDKVIGKSGLIVKVFIRGKGGTVSRRSEYADRLSDVLKTDYKKDGKNLHHFITADIWGKTDLELFELVKNKYVEILTDLHDVGIITGKVEMIK